MIWRFPVQRFVVAFLLLLSINSFSYAGKGCPGDDYLRLKNGRFDMCLPLQTYKNAVIGPNGNGVLVKFSSGAFFGIEVITPGMDSMPETYDMRLYPEEILGLQTYEGRTPKQAEVLSNTRAYMKSYYGDAAPVKYKSKGKTFYIISKELEAEAYVSIDDVKDQILFFSFGKMDKQTIKIILEGVQ
jgi:hypothetical protein